MQNKEIPNVSRLFEIKRLAIEYWASPKEELLQEIRGQMKVIQDKLRQAQFDREKIAYEKNQRQPKLQSQNGSKVASAIIVALEQVDVLRNIFLSEQKAFLYSKTDIEVFLIYEAEFDIWKRIKFENNEIMSISQFQIEGDPQEFIDVVLSELN